LNKRTEVANQFATSVRLSSPEVTQTVFVHESGGHFSKVPQRIARGINGIIK